MDNFPKEKIINFIENYTDDLVVVYYNPKSFTQEQIKVIENINNVYEVLSTELVPEGEFLLMKAKHVKPLKFIESEKLTGLKQTATFVDDIIAWEEKIKNEKNSN